MTTVFTNPVAPGADPFVFKDDDGTYYLYVTADDDYGYRVYSSRNLVEWTAHGFCLLRGDVYTDPNSKYGYRFWAPEVMKYNGKYYMVYTAQHRIGIAVADRPTGPFRTGTKEYLINSCNVIDGSFFTDDDGKVYLYFVKCRNGNHIHGVEFDMETLRPKGTPVLLLSPQSGTWEKVSGTVAEGPFVLKHNGLYYLTYSANGYTSQNYALGSATSASPLGTFTRTAGNPFLKKDPAKNVYGPGHHSFFTAKNGTPMIVYHIHNSATEVHSRMVCVDPYSFVSFPGEPDRIVVAGPTNTPQPIPN